MPIQKTIRDIEIRPHCVIIHCTDGTELKFSHEEVELENGKKTCAGVMRYGAKIIWTDKK